MFPSVCQIKRLKTWQGHTSRKVDVPFKLSRIQVDSTEFLAISDLDKNPRENNKRSVINAALDDLTLY